jgi:hypothetical protein
MKIDTLEPDFKAIMQNIIKQVSEATGLHWIVVSGRRTMKEQGDLYAQGRTKPGKKVTNAPPGSSAHNFGLGCDVAPLAVGNDHDIWWSAPSGYWEAYGAYCEAAGMTWGGNFKNLVDNPHCENPRWRDEQDKWRKGILLVA